MTEAGTETELVDEAPERGLLRREYATELTPAGDGRTIDVRIVPYGERIEHNDGLGGVPKGVVYREEWAPGCFDEQLVAGHRLKVLLNFEHHKGIENVVGKGVALRSARDGLHGTFRALENEAGRTALELVNDGILDGVSLEAKPKKSVRTADGVVHRIRAHLVNVALCRSPAYSGARVLAVRTETIIDEDLLPVAIDPELAERLRARGVALPDRYKAHPAEPDTPAETGTSEDGTRQPAKTTSSKE
jgi:HK97 family phage prohead protease